MPSVETRHLKGGRVSYFVRLRDPRRRKYTSETFATKREAEKFCAEVNLLGPAAALERREAGSRRRTSPTLGELIEPYLTWRSTRVRSDRTIADYRRDWRNWIAPTFGERQLDDLSENDIRRWVDGMAAGLHGRPPASAKSIADRHALLSGFYTWAIREKHTLVNPCVGTDLPKRRRRPVKALRPAEWQALYAALRQIDPDAADLAEFLAHTGWRFSEAAALSAYDVEDYGDVMWVTMGRVVRRNAAGQHVIVEDAKSDAGQRRIRLGSTIAETVRRRLDHVRDGGLVFTTATGAQWHYSNLLNRVWNKAVKAANLSRRPTPHWLRHSHVVWLSGTHQANLAEIQRRIGHEHIETTIGVYGRMIEDVPDSALDALDAMLAPSQTPQIEPKQVRKLPKRNTATPLRLSVRGSSLPVTTCPIGQTGPPVNESPSGRIAAAIRTAMATRKVSQNALSEFTGIPRATLIRRLNGHTPFNVDELWRVCQALDLDMVQVQQEAAA